MLALVIFVHNNPFNLVYVILFIIFNIIIWMDDSSEKYSLLKDKIKEYFENENNLDKLISVQIDKVKKLGNLGIEVKTIEYKVNRFKDVLQHKCKKCQMKMLDDLLNSRAKTPEHIKSRSYITSCDEMIKVIFVMKVILIRIM